MMLFRCRVYSSDLLPAQMDEDIAGEAAEQLIKSGDQLEIVDPYKEFRTAVKLLSYGSGDDREEAEI